MSTYQSATPIAQEFASTLLTTYGNNTTGYVTETIDVSSYDLITLVIDLAVAGAEDTLDLEILHSGRPTTPGFDPDANPAVGAYDLPEDMDRILLPSNLSQDLEFSITGVAARVASGAFRRLLTIDVLGLSSIRIAAKADVVGGTLTLSMLPNGPDQPRTALAPVR